MLLCCLLFVSSASAARNTPTATPPLYPEATLAPGGNDYDETHPEELDPSNLYAWSAILIDAESDSGADDPIFEKSADEIRNPASTTKIMTCYLALREVEDLYQTVTVSERAVDIPEGSSTMKLVAGEQLPFIDVLYGTMLLSGNDGANVIAETVSGSIEAFVELMNRTAAELGCSNTHFNNAHGYTDPYHYTTARDLATIAKEAMSHEQFREIVGTQSYTLAKTNEHKARTITNTNELFRPGTEESPNKYYYPYANGVKTGNTDAAQYCFVGSAEKDGVHLISVVMYSGKRARWRDTILLMNYGFSMYVSVTPLELYNMNPLIIETSSYSTSDPNLGKLELTCIPQDPSSAEKTRLTVQKDYVQQMANDFRRRILLRYTRSFRAPIEAGELMGTMTYVTGSGEPFVYNLIASRSIAQRENMPKTLSEIWQETLEEGNPLPPFNATTAALLIIVGGVVFAIVHFLNFLLSRRRRRRSNVPKTVNHYLK